MTMTPTHTIYVAAGCPPMPGGQEGVCRLCGTPDKGMAFDIWVKDTFTDQDKLQPGTITCHACQFCTAESAPGLAERVGKDKPQKMRNYSHFVLDGEWHPLSKGNKAEMRKLLFAGAPVAVIAESGQKHLLPFARLGWWTFELAIARPFPDELGSLLALVELLYQAGITKAEIATGRYSHARILALGLDTWLRAEASLTGKRGSLPLQLALFLAQKEIEDGQGTDSN